MRFLVNGYNGAISFAEIFLNEENLFNKRLNVIEVPRLPQALINNLGELSASDVAFIVFNQFFGKNVSSDLIKAFTSNCIDSLIGSHAENRLTFSRNNPVISSLSVESLTAVIINCLLQYYVSAARIKPDVNVVCYGDVGFLTAANKHMGSDIIAFTNVAETQKHKSDFPLFAIIGDDVVKDGQLVAAAVCQLNSTCKRTLFFSPQNVASLLAYAFIIIEKIRESVSDDKRAQHYRMSAESSDQMLSEALKLVNALGFEIEECNRKDLVETDSTCINIRAHGHNPKLDIKRQNESIANIAPSVQIIKQLII